MDAELSGVNRYKVFPGKLPMCAFCASYSILNGCSHEDISVADFIGNQCAGFWKGNAVSTSQVMSVLVDDVGMIVTMLNDILLKLEEL